ncbi:uncharacterized protein LOC128546807 [Mercenaria mercenaria]|uniref:uncharacterized protein LOC128546807 n=1 Tax=Mercenaria mercenaria TaxID=6596 RepID=UPI00234F3068|nr:uncharacterized protein LOC128546807 [Mercenaria mercenaria]
MELRTKHAATVSRDIHQGSSTAFPTTRKQELKSAGGSENEDGSVRKCINPKYANDTKLNLDTIQIHKDEIRNQDKGLYNLDGSDGEDATAATSKGIYQEPSMTFTSERKQKYGKSSVKDSENKKRTYLMDILYSSAESFIVETQSDLKFREMQLNLEFQESEWERKERIRLEEKKLEIEREKREREKNKYNMN